MAKNQRNSMCSFCARTADEVERLISGPGVFICNHCVSACDRMLKAEAHDDSPSTPRKSVGRAKPVPKPSEIVSHLDQHIVGQSQAKRVLAVAVYNHYRRIEENAAGKSGGGEYDGVKLEKSNVLLLGPTGSGKTLLAKALAELLDVPFSIADATTLTEAGYVGEDVENIILRLLQSADSDVTRAERGIIYVDEIDKISRTTHNASITRDVSGEGVQQALLKILEGTVCQVPPQGGRKHPQQEYIPVNTENILFICGGAFVGLPDMIERRMGRGRLGFALENAEESEKPVDPEAILSQVEPADLVKYGLIPEFVGRLPVFCHLDKLTEDELVRILTEPKNALVKQYEKMLALEGVRLKVTKDALSAIAGKALERGTGARGLRSILEKIMLDVMYEIPGQSDIRSVTINAQTVKGEKPPVIRRKADAA